MKSREISNHSIFKVNKNKLLLANKQELDIIIYIIKEDQE